MGSLRRRIRKARSEIRRRCVAFLRKRLPKWGLTVVSHASRRQMISTIRLVRPSNTEHALTRFGSAHDGGYLVPDDLHGMVACFSPGVSTSVDFELDMARRGIPSFMIDASIDALPQAHPMFTFQALWLGPEDNEARRTISLSTWLAQHAKETGAGDLILQMDIEDAEWAVLHSTPDSTLQRFRIIVLELHDLTSLASRKGNLYIRDVFEKLHRHFIVVHAHPNNVRRPERINGVKIHPLLEITLLRRDRVTHSEPATSFPHALDARNVTGRPDVRLAPIWIAR